jgi:glycosyltransferase involved in cell wall biosynthesis
MMRVLSFTKYGRAAASTRHRVLQYLPRLAEAGIEVDHHALIPDDYVLSLASQDGYSRAALARRYRDRFRQLRAAKHYDLIWVYAEMFPKLPAAFERLVFRSGRPILYDIDDAFFHQYDDHPRAPMRWLLGGKLEPLLRGARLCCCGNDYLRDYALRFCPDARVLPTVVDTEIYRPRAGPPPEGPPLVGWIGSPSTWCNVQPILPVLEEVVRSGLARVRVIGAGREAERDRFPGLEMADWSEPTEVEEVRAMDIGIMPLLDLPFQRGKSGFKLIQYMACGLPVVAAPVGVNGQIVGGDRHGFLARAPGEWRDALFRLIGDPALRSRMGEANRERAVALYSLAAQAPHLIAAMRDAVQRPAVSR